MRLFNTLSGKKETFSPREDGQVGMYNCGPTVYKSAHIGNLRSYVFADILRRALEYSGLSVKQVINITDVGHIMSDADEGEDKIEKEARTQGKSASEIAGFYENTFLEDLKRLNVRTGGTIFPRATDHIEEQIELIRTLERKGFTYETSNGVYFDTSKVKDYGKLGNINIDGLEEGARVEKNPEKKNSTDFALWKTSAGEIKRQQEWPSPWGVGFPGWHIECSAMAMKYLGETLDIHTGGIDHIPVHHNNEIAQSESATGRQFSRFWLHNAHVNLEDGKMAKSDGNFITLETLVGMGYWPSAYRYWLLTAHYSSPITFSYEALGAAQSALAKLVRLFSSLPLGGRVSETYSRKFKEMINNDLDTPQVVSLIWQMLKDNSIADAEKRATLLDMDKVLGLNLSRLSEVYLEETRNIPNEIMDKVRMREKARELKNWQSADSIRDEVRNLGFIIDDTEDGVIVRRKKS